MGPWTLVPHHRAVRHGFGLDGVVGIARREQAIRVVGIRRVGDGRPLGVVPLPAAKPCVARQCVSAHRCQGPVAAVFSAAAVCSSEAMVFSGFLIFFTLRQPRKPNKAAISTITKNTMVKAAQVGSQIARIHATMNQKKNVEKAPMTPAMAKKTPPVAPVFTVSVIAGSVSANVERITVDMCVDTSLSTVPMDAPRSTAGSATSGMEAPVDPGR